MKFIPEWLGWCLRVKKSIWYFSTLQFDAIDTIEVPKTLFYSLLSGYELPIWVQFFDNWSLSFKMQIIVFLFLSLIWELLLLEIGIAHLFTMLIKYIYAKQCNIFCCLVNICCAKQSGIYVDRWYSKYLEFDTDQDDKNDKIIINKNT